MPTDVNRAALPLIDLLRMDEADFKTRFAGSPIARIKRERLVRNVCVAAGNWGNKNTVPALVDLLRDPSPLVRGHAVWALARIQGESVRSILTPLLDREPDPQAQAEIRAAMQL